MTGPSLAYIVLGGFVVAVSPPLPPVQWTRSSRVWLDNAVHSQKYRSDMIDTLGPAVQYDFAAREGEGAHAVSLSQGTRISRALQLYINEVVLGTGFGVLMGPHVANIFDPRSWGSDETSQRITLEVMRIVLATGLFAIGVELPQSYLADHAKSLLVMVVPTMAFGWLIVAGASAYHRLTCSSSPSSSYNLRPLRAHQLHLCPRYRGLPNTDRPYHLRGYSRYVLSRVSCSSGQGGQRSPVYAPIPSLLGSIASVRRRMAQYTSHAMLSRALCAARTFALRQPALLFLLCGAPHPFVARA